MVGNVLIALMVAVMASFAIANRYAPHMVARFAMAPVRRRVAIPLPPRAAALLTPPQEGGGTYRDLPARNLAFAALPGATRVQRDDQIVRFVPELGCVLAHPEWSPAQLLCVHVSGGADGLSLRGRRFPEAELLASAVLMVLIARWDAFRHWPAAISVVAAFVFVLGKARRDAGVSFDAVVAELKARIALANGDPPPPAPPQPPTASRFTGPDEWTCACGKVNERKRSMCRRCWAQRPAG
jgi:hypothetical protein